MNFIYDVFIEPFRIGDWAPGILACIVLVVILGMVIFAVYFAIEEHRWDKCPEFTVKAKLLNAQYAGSTRRTETVPVVTGDGLGVGFVTTGNPEKTVTVWDCGKYGRLITDDENIFRWAKAESTLYLKERGDEVRIVGIDV